MCTQYFIVSSSKITGNALEKAINVGLPSNAASFVTGIGCATLGRNADTDSTECGGCLAGSGFTGDADGTPVVEDATGAVSTVTVEVRINSDACQDSSCFNELYDQTVMDLREFVDTGTLTVEIGDWARKRVRHGQAGCSEPCLVFINDPC